MRRRGRRGLGPRLAALSAAIGLALPAALAAAAPPCLPCGGLTVEDPAALAAALAAAPALGPEERLYAAWDVDLGRIAEGPAGGAGEEGARAAALAGAGATPWVRLVFRAPAPLATHFQRLERELEAAAEIARRAGERAHFQVLWRPEPAAAADAGAPRESPEGAARELAFLIKRAAVALTGANPGARVVTGPLAPDPERLEALYGEEIEAYLDGVALAPAPESELAAAVAALERLDPGRALVLDALPWPEEPAELLAAASRSAAEGFAVTLFSGWRPGDPLAPAKLLAREFAGDLARDPYSEPAGELDAWAFVRGEDLGLRVVLRPRSPVDELVAVFPDGDLRRPARVDPDTGEAIPLAGVRRVKEGLEVRLFDPAPVEVLRLERLTASELAAIEGVEGLEERLLVTGERSMPVAEILRRLQAFEDAQNRRLEHYSAVNTSHLRFQIGTGAQSVEATFRGDFFFRREGGFDWAWQEFLINGVKWRRKTIPEIPLVQPEKASALPVEITFTREYRYELRGTATVGGRDCWVVDFRPAVAVEPGRSLFQGTLWVDREIYARVKTRAVQLGLEGEVVSNDETVEYAPLDPAGRPASWSADSHFLPVRLTGQQIWSILNGTAVVEREILLTEIEINGDGFAERRRAVLDSEATMVRDTERGLRYLVADKESGERVVKEEIDRNRRFLVGGAFYDESQDFPIPLAGMNWFWFDWRGTGLQANVFFGGALANVAATRPRVFGSRFDLGFDVFALAIAPTDTVFRDGREVNAEDVKSIRPNLDLKLGRPIGSFFKLDLEYELGYAKYSRADDTAPGFALPSDHFSHRLSLAGRYNRKGYRMRLGGAYHLRSQWEPWGFPGNPEYEPDDDRYTTWRASVGKTWHLPKFLKFGAELEYVDGSNLDRFSKYEFGFFSSVRVHGYQSDKVRAEQALALHLTYGFDVGDLFRLDLVGDAAWATDRASGLEDELLAGAGIAGTVIGPWSTVVNVDLGVALAGPDEGVSAFVSFLKLFK